MKTANNGKLMSVFASEWLHTQPKSHLIKTNTKLIPWRLFPQLVFTWTTNYSIHLAFWLDKLARFMVNGQKMRIAYSKWTRSYRKYYSSNSSSMSNLISYFYRSMFLIQSSETFYRSSAHFLDSVFITIYATFVFDSFFLVFYWPNILVWL